VQFTKYGIDQHYHWHIDGQCDHHASKVLSPSKDKNYYDRKGMIMPITETQNPHHVGLCRKISVTINLSDPLDYDGGDLWLTKHPQDSRISELETFTNPSFRDKGAVVVFPSWIRHRVTPVTRGTRYSAVAWFNGPPLR
jgi:predicted 2-oxoglutarate/Fe(II)-dependent dioxygenase YbiX